MYSCVYTHMRIYSHVHTHIYIYSAHKMQRLWSTRAAYILIRNDMYILIFTHTFTITREFTHMYTHKYLHTQRMRWAPKEHSRHTYAHELMCIFLHLLICLCSASGARALCSASGARAPHIYSYEMICIFLYVLMCTHTYICTYTQRMRCSA